MSAEHPDPSPHRWRAADPAARFHRGAASSSARHRKALILLAVILALTGAIAAWLFYPRGLPVTAFVTIPIREYSDYRYPINPFALQDSNLLVARFPKDLAHHAYTSQDRGSLLGELNALRGRSDRALVLHLRAHALRQGNTVYVLPADADPGNADTWLALDRVLESLRQCPVRHKLLLLDIMGPLADPRLGILRDDAAAGVAALLEKETDPNLLILCACEPGQVSLASEDLQLSVFGYYLDQGLRGHADGHNPRGEIDGRVTVKELAEYVRQHVDRWAWHNRSARQTPVLYGKGADFALVGYERDAIPPPDPLSGPEPLPDRLRDQWKVHDQWQAGPLFRRAPRAFAQFEAVLLRFEARWRGGIEIERAHLKFKEIFEKIQPRVDKANAAWQPALPSPRSFTLARRQDLKAYTAAGAATRALLRKLAPDAGVDAKAVEKAKAEFQDNFKAAPFADVAAAAFDAAVADPTPTGNKIDLLQHLLASLKPTTRYLETLYLQRLGELLKKAKERDWQWRVDVVSQLLLTVQEAEKAVGCDPADLPWIKLMFREADSKRREGERLLFAGRPENWSTALALLQEAEKGYAAVTARVMMLDEARQVRDEALAFLPGYVPYLTLLPERDSQDLLTWKSGVRAATDLDTALAHPKPDETEAVDARRREGRLHLQTLRLALAARATRLLKLGEEGTPADYAELQALLACPRVEVDQRQALWLAARKLALQLHGQTREADEAQALGRPLPAGFRVPTGADAGADDSRVIRRADLSIGLLRLSDLDRVDQLQKGLDQFAGAPTDANVTDLAGKLYRAWAEQLPAQLRMPSNLAQADRLHRLVDLFDPQSGSAAAASAPAVDIRRKQVDDYRRWLAQRYREESQAVGAATPFGVFYEEAAKAVPR
jgi:hypothetical protein